MPENFTDQEWNEYLTKVKQLKPLNDKEWEEYDRQLHLDKKNPNYDFYPKPPSFDFPQFSQSYEPPKKYKQKNFEEYHTNNHLSDDKGFCVFIGVVIVVIFWLILL